MLLRTMLLLLMAAGATEGVLAQELFAPTGRFDLIDIRAPGAASSSAVDDGGQPSGAIAFGPTLHWLDGRACTTWGATPWNGIPFDLHDPALADMLIEPAAGRPNRRLVALFEIVCDGDALGSLTFVDARVAIAFHPDQGSFRILVVPPSPGQVGRLQSALAGLGLYSGPANGLYDDATRAAVADYLATLGLARIERPALTANLLDRLGALE